ncbi:MAG: Asp-tRNA(Asn)/Glu-tRNA(Gln) amidotransferase subunit GatC [Pseudomonadales bacterium]|nr:Asp-tRNA(Asn)/Glu-tRNA(Gln) amidotransferase subunit GatC [Pseudomonadales bacterium]
MALDAKALHNIAHLARLDMTEQDVVVYQNSLNAILTMIDSMQAIDTKVIAPMAHPLDATQPLRHDVVTETNQRELYQTLAPATEQGLYLVPRVIE